LGEEGNIAKVAVQPGDSIDSIEDPTGDGVEPAGNAVPSTRPNFSPPLALQNH
jgi:hypothetical protein